MSIAVDLEHKPNGRESLGKRAERARDLYAVLLFTVHSHRIESGTMAFREDCVWYLSEVEKHLK